jgi:photosystem II stability/assembly factor-like uncharacterized protein
VRKIRKTILIIALGGLAVLFVALVLFVSNIVFQENVSVNDNFIGPSGSDGERDKDSVFNSLVVSPTNPGIVYLGTELNGIFRSTDGGNNWESLQSGLYHNKRSYPEVYDILINPKDENSVYAALTNGPQPPSIEKAAGFYVSINAGNSWSRKTKGLPNTAINSLALGNDLKTLFIGIDGQKPSNDRVEDDVAGGIYKSQDNGESWEPVGIPDVGIGNKFIRIAVRKNYIYSLGVRYVDAKPGEPRLPDPQSSIGLIRSKNNGKSWEQINPTGVLPGYFDVSADASTIYFSTFKNGQTYRSVDYGNNWKKIPTSRCGRIKVSPFKSNKVFCANGYQLFVSNNSLELNTMVLDTQSRIINDIEFTSDPNIVYVATDGYILYKSTDSGVSFSEVANLRTKIEGLRAVNNKE